MKIQILEHDYMNTGGGCMVSIFYTLLPDEKKAVFVAVNEEGCTISTTDIIRHSIDTEDWMIVDDVQFEDLLVDNKYFELYQTCMLEYFKRDCQRYKITQPLKLHLYPQEMIDKLPVGYVKWHETTVGKYFATNGHEIVLDESWLDDNHQIGAASELIEYMSAEFDSWTKTDREEAFYNKEITIGFGNVTRTFANNAASYQAVLECLKMIIDEY